MSGYTPGPWSVYVPASVGATFGIESEDGKAVVWFGATADEGIRRIEDANLIAAAPELLEALKELLAEAESEIATCPLTRQQARAAIAKATQP